MAIGFEIDAQKCTECERCMALSSAALRFSPLPPDRPRMRALFLEGYHGTTGGTY